MKQDVKQSQREQPIALNRVGGDHLYIRPDDILMVTTGPETGLVYTCGGKYVFEVLRASALAAVTAMEDAARLPGVSQ